MVGHKPLLGGHGSCSDDTAYVNDDPQMPNASPTENSRKPYVEFNHS